MPLDLKSTISQMNSENIFQTTLVRPLSEWSPTFLPLLGETILPSMNRPNNKYTEIGVKYRSLVANDGSRYSPAQKKGSAIVGKMDVELTDQDIAADFTAEDYDNALAVNNVNVPATNINNSNMAGIMAVTNWYAANIVRPLEQKKEVMRWQAIVDSVVQLRGDNGFSQDIPLSSPANNRVYVGQIWSNPNSDPLQDIYAQMEFMATKGYSIGRIITGHKVAFTLLNHPKVKSAVGGYVTVSGTGALVNNTARVTIPQLNNYLGEHGLPPIELYDQTYSLDSPTPTDFTTTTQWYLARDAFVLMATTERDVTISRGDLEPVIYRSVHGYHGVGRPAGAAGPGIMANSKYEGDKPPRLSAQAWQTTYPVIQDPESFSVLRGCA